MSGSGRERSVFLDQSLAEAARRLGAVASAAFGAIGAFPRFARGPVLAGRGIRRSRGATAIAASVAIEPGVSAAVARAEFGVVGQVAAVIPRFDVGDVQEAVAADREVDEGGLNGRFEIDDAAFVDVAGIAFVAVAFHVQFFQDAVLDDGDPAFLGLKNVDKHFFFHAGDLSVAFTLGVMIGSSRFG